MIAGVRLLVQTALRTGSASSSSVCVHTSTTGVSLHLSRLFGRKTGSTKKNKEIVDFEDRMKELQAAKESAEQFDTGSTPEAVVQEKEQLRDKTVGELTSKNIKTRDLLPPKMHTPDVIVKSTTIQSTPKKISDIEFSEDEITPFYPEDDRKAAKFKKQKVPPPKPVKTVTIKATKPSEDNEQGKRALTDGHSEQTDTAVRTSAERGVVMLDDGRLPAGEWSALPQISLKREDLEDMDIEFEGSTLRLSKYLSRCGIASRRQAEQMLEEGLVRINGKKALANVMIDPSKDKITIFTKRGEYFPIQEKTKIWSFYKPMGLICTHKDTHNRPTIFDYIKKTGFIKEDYFISVGRLDYNSEGLILLTNDGELARSLELPLHKLERTYRVRVYGRFNDEKLANIRKGAVINGVQYGPFYCEVDSYQTRNTWLIVKMHQGKNREIRRIMQKNDLRVNRLKRIAYGPYNLGNLPSGHVREEPIVDQIKRLMYLATRKKLETVQNQNIPQQQLKEEVVKKLEGRLLDPLPLLKKATEMAVSAEKSKALQDKLTDDATPIAKY